MNSASNVLSNETTLKRWPWENPIGEIRGYLEEPETPEIDPYDAAEREAIESMECEEEKKWKN